MKCAYHSEADALGTCVKCGKPVCEICRVEVAGKTYCKNCVVKEIEERNPHLLATILGYIFGFFGGLLGIVFGIYLLTKEHPKAKFHGKIVLAITAIMIVFWISMAILGS